MDSGMGALGVTGSPRRWQARARAARRSRQWPPCPRCSGAARLPPARRRGRARAAARRAPGTRRGRRPAPQRRRRRRRTRQEAAAAKENKAGGGDAVDDDRARERVGVEEAGVRGKRGARDLFEAQRLPARARDPDAVRGRDRARGRQLAEPRRAPAAARLGGPLPRRAARSPAVEHSAAGARPPAAPPRARAATRRRPRP
jgi:hypothetical protein